MGRIQDMISRLRGVPYNDPRRTFLTDVVSGSFYKVSDVKRSTDFGTICSLIDTMRVLAKDSQVSTALSYYATDATTPNSSGQIIWATGESGDRKSEDAAELTNTLFKRWNINNYARDHILELLTVGNLYLPTTEMTREVNEDATYSKMYIGLDQNDIPQDNFDIIPSHKIDPKEIVHLWKDYKPYGFLYQPEETDYNGRMAYSSSTCVLMPETSVIHFSLGGLIGNYSIVAVNNSGEEEEYDIQFATPLMEAAVQPTQTLNLLEDATVLASLIKVVRFICIDTNGVDEEEQMQTLAAIKNSIEQKMSFNTGTGDAQSYLNPGSPNNLIYLPRVNGQNPIDIVDLNMTDQSEAADKLLEYYQDKKLSVLGVPKEALNFSSSEGLGGAGAVMSQRSALYANALQRIETAYINGWTDALNKYFIARNMDQYVNKFELHMNPIMTEMSQLQFDKRDSALSQASQLVDLLGSLGVDDAEKYKEAITEILLEALPKTSSSVNSWDIDTSQQNGEEGF